MLIVSLWVCVVRNAQSTLDVKFAISLQYLKGNMKDEVDFLATDKQQRFLQIDTIILDVCDQACPIYPNNKLPFSLQYFRKEMSDEVDFFACR